MENSNRIKQTPIFICGYPKSGTTLLASLLDGHPELLVIPEETRFFSKVLESDDSDKLNFMFNKTNVSVLKKAQVEAASGTRDYSEIDFDYLLKSSRQYWDSSEKQNKNILESLVFGLSASLKKNEFKYWVEKSPFNENYLAVQQRYWPGSKSIMIIRDPRQTFCSHRDMWRNRLGKNKIKIANFVTRWKSSINNFDNYIENGGCGIVIRYEDLVSDTETVIKGVVDFLGISFDRLLLCPTRCGKSWEGNSSIENKKFEKVENFKFNYQDKLKKSEIQYIESKLGQKMKEKNYQPLYDKSALFPFWSIFYSLEPKIDSLRSLILVKGPQLIKKTIS